MAPSRSRGGPGGRGRSAKGDGKKKGPKGKKARAKAKLDRQWGERPLASPPAAAPARGGGSDEGAAAPSRDRRRGDRRGRGASAIGPAEGPAARGGEGDRGRSARHDDDRRGLAAAPPCSDSDDGSERDEPAGSRLLRSLRRHRHEKRRDGTNVGSRSHRMMHRDDEDEGSESGGSEASGEDEEDREGRAADEADEGGGDGGSGDEGGSDGVGLGWDPFEDRYAESAATPLPEADGERRAVLERRAGPLETVPVSDPSLVLQASSGLLDRLGIRREGAANNGGAGEPRAAPSPPSEAADAQLRRLARSLFQRLRPALRSNWSRGGEAASGPVGGAGPSTSLPPPSSLLLYPCVASYADVLAANEASRRARRSHLEAVAVHLLDHVLRSREIVRRNDHSLALRRQQQRQQANEATGGTDEDPPRDQGFTRPTVLVLAPTRSGCYELVTLLRSLLRDRHASDATQQPEQRPRSDGMDSALLERFEAEYGPPEQPPEPTKKEPHEDAEEEEMRRRRRRHTLRQKGSDWLELFGDDVNSDDDFKLGLAVQRSGGGRSGKGAGKGEHCLRLFADFYRSDVIVASPLGLKILLERKDDGGDDAEDGDDGRADQGPEERRGGKDGQRGHDFLSSIEICYISRADVLLMQNWDHVSDVVRLLNEQPRCSTAIDYSRVRPYHLHEGQSQHWRQLIVTSSFVDPMILSLFKRHAKSLAGSVRLRRRALDASEASIARVVLPTRQVFQRIPTHSLADHASDRVRYFCGSVLPEIARQKQKHTLVFIPSYFDFVSVRNVMLKREVDFVSVTEYSRVSEVSRGRARFLQGRKPIMLYTGRAHFFHRHAIKGARHLIFLGLPEFAEFYSGLVNSLSSGSDGDGDVTMTGTHEASCLVLFTKYEGHALERIVGGQNGARMLQGDTSTFLL